MNTCIASRLVHEVIAELYDTIDKRSSIRLELRCGGYVWVERGFPWQHDDAVLTCLWCIAASHRRPFYDVNIEGTCVT